MKRLAPFLAIAFALSALLMLAGVRNWRPGEDAQPRRALDPLWKAPDWSFRDQHGQATTQAALAGDVWVANFVYTQCRTVCPMLTAKMVQLQRRLAGVKVRFVSFSVDPAHDTPDVLRAYADQWAPDERRWTLLATGDEAALTRLAEGFKVIAMKSEDKADPILHTAVFLLVDGAGQLRGVFDTERAEEVDALERGVRTLVGAGAGKNGTPLPTTGEGLYHALSCDNCHERAELAPPLSDLVGRRRELESGLVVEADVAYVRESIVAPDVKRVRSYPLRMPTYAGLVDDARLGTLVSWIAARRGGAGAGEQAAAVEDDPVCHMKVRVAAGTPSAEVAGRRVHFCSDYCKDRFVANPSAFPAQGADAAAGLPDAAP